MSRIIRCLALLMVVLAISSVFVIASEMENEMESEIESQTEVFESQLRPRHRMKQQRPVPLHFRRPLIDTSATSSPEKTAQLSTLAKIVAKEPIAAKLTPRDPSADEMALWNGEDISAEDKAMRQAKIVRKEIKSLRNLINQGRAIIRVLPKKQGRLKKLEKKINCIRSNCK